MKSVASRVCGTQGCGKPVGECRPLLGGEWMDDCVAPRRHFTVENHFRRLAHFLVAPLPLRKVENAPPFVHIPLHEPGHRRDMRIPGPRCLIAVTVETHSHRKRASRGAIPNRFLHHGRVRVTPPVRDELCGDQKPTSRNRRPPHGSPVRPAHGHGGDRYGVRIARLNPRLSGFRIRHLPVLTKGTLVGILSQRPDQVTGTKR